MRRRLHEAPDEGTQRALTLISAPPGAGKTVLLGSWIAAGGPPGPVAWLSLGSADVDRRRFWRAVRRVAVEGFWIDERPVTVAEFRRFVKATGHVSVAERPLDPADYPGADPEALDG